MKDAPKPYLSAPVTGALLAALGALGFATLGIWGKLAGQVGLNPFAALAWRFLIVAAVLLPFTWRNLTWPQRFQTLKVGLVYGISTTFYFAALTRISAGTTSLLLYLAPALIILFNWLAGRRPSATQLIAVALAASGLVLIVGLPGPADHDQLGLLLAAVTAGLYAAFLLSNEHFLRGLPSLTTTAHTTFFAGIYFTLFGLVTHQFQIPSQPSQWGIVTGMAVIATLIPVPAIFIAIQRLGAANTSLIATLEPVFAVLMAAAILGEPLRPSLLLGGVLILGGALMAQHPGFGASRNRGVVDRNQ